MAKFNLGCVHYYDSIMTHRICDTKKPFKNAYG